MGTIDNPSLVLSLSFPLFFLLVNPLPDLAKLSLHVLIIPIRKVHSERRFWTSLQAASPFVPISIKEVLSHSWKWLRYESIWKSGTQPILPPDVAGVVGNHNVHPNKQNLILPLHRPSHVTQTPLRRTPLNISRLEAPKPILPSAFLRRSGVHSNPRFRCFGLSLPSFSLSSLCLSFYYEQSLI